jgi:23S rRNA G2069 N7-methylase RlmK/C1962 C5-methylase RlmI
MSQPRPPRGPQGTGDEGRGRTPRTGGFHDGPSAPGRRDGKPAPGRQPAKGRQPGTRPAAVPLGETAANDDRKDRRPAVERPADEPLSARAKRQQERFEMLKNRRKGGAKPAGPDGGDWYDEDDEALDSALDELEACNGRPDTGEAAGSGGESLVWDPERVKAQAEMFGNRLKKCRQHLWKWARRTGVSCFRIYDRDIPELPFQVDEYEKHLHIAQIVRVRSVDEEHARLWTETMVEAAARSLGVEPSKVFVKNRVQQKGKDQYEKFGSAGYLLTAHEAGLDFELNLSDYLDTGLFLDHRDTRIMVGGLSLGARVLNLFSYTGSFSVHAARGGALSTTSVDMSNTYTQWAERNLALNGFGGKSHRCICDDVLKWIPGAVERKEQFDIIVCDPPTFSNSKKMEGVFDVQRDHPWLINQLLRLLSRNGIIVFSNNFRKFKLDEGALDSRYVDDITFKSTPEDFAGKKPHKCYVIKRDR